MIDLRLLALHGLAVKSAATPEAVAALEMMRAMVADDKGVDPASANWTINERLAAASGYRLGWSSTASSSVSGR